MNKQQLPYGLWPSPISPDVIAAQIRLSDVQFDSDGQTIVWLEGRSGRGVLVARRGEDAPRDLTEDLPVRAGVGYGGGDFTVGNGMAVFSSGGRLYRIPLDTGRPQPITPGFGEAASPRISPDGKRVLFVHSYEHNDSLALVDSSGERWPVKLVHGADFYMQPAWHPDGSRIAWVEWDHPQMPWDGTRLKLAHVDEYDLVEVSLVAGDEDTPVFQPEFSPDGRFLSYLVQEGDADRLYLYDLHSNQKRILVEAVSLLPPAWTQGLRVQAWDASSSSIFFLRNDLGTGTLWAANVSDGGSRQIDVPAYTWLVQPAASPSGNRIAFIGSSPKVPDRVVTWMDGRLRVECRSTSETVHPDDLAFPRPITWSATNGTAVHGLFYPPSSSGFTAEGKPPAIISIHGGPTSQRMAHYNAEAAFFTSRGYAYIEVNYRGSTGYGRNYMLALRQNWGKIDTEDAVGAARALSDQGLADPDRLVIKGGSAGGYTVLNALIHHPGVFKAGICLYGVSNLFTLSMDTHKFEERYNDSMVGPLPESADRYREWSPIFHADKIRDPVAVFQGAEDKVVVPEQSETIVQALKANKVPHVYRLYEGEGHGWRKPDTIADYYRTVEKFLKEHVLFA